MTQPNTEILKRMPSVSPEHRMVLEYISGRERPRTDLAVYRLIRAIKVINRHADTSKIRDAVRMLQTAGVGRITKNSRGNPSRLHWDFDLRTVGQVALGKADILTPYGKKVLARKQVVRVPRQERIHMVEVSKGTITIRHKDISLEVPMEVTNNKLAAIIGAMEREGK